MLISSSLTKNTVGFEINGVVANVFTRPKDRWKFNNPSQKIAWKVKRKFWLFYEWTTTEFRGT